MLGEKFEAAMLRANEWHRDHLRKQTTIPYISHLLAVTALVLENGGDEEQAIAALLHDAVEDAGGPDTLAKIRAEFGDRVARIVNELSDTDVVPKPPWRARKEAYLAHLDGADDEVRLVSACDKVHNASSIVEDLATVGAAVWDRFSGGRDGSLWYYESLAAIYARRGPHRLAARLATLVTQMRNGPR